MQLGILLLLVQTNHSSMSIMETTQIVNVFHVCMTGTLSAIGLI